MESFSKAAAERCFEIQPLGEQGALVARYWLSLWNGDSLPLRAEFKPRDISSQLGRIAIFDVTPGVSVRCRLFGSMLAQGLGMDVTGQDWLALTPKDLRATRLERFTSVANGGIGRGLRPARRESGEAQYSEEIMLPFGDIAADGSRQVLMHIGWRPTTYDPTVATLATSGGLSIEFRLTDIRIAQKAA